MISLFYTRASLSHTYPFSLWACGPLVATMHRWFWWSFPRSGLDQCLPRLLLQALFFISTHLTFSVLRSPYCVGSLRSPLICLVCTRAWLHACLPVCPTHRAPPNLLLTSHVTPSSFSGGIPVTHSKMQFQLSFFVCFVLLCYVAYGSLLSGGPKISAGKKRPDGSCLANARLVRSPCFAFIHFTSPVFDYFLSVDFFVPCEIAVRPRAGAGLATGMNLVRTLSLDTTTYYR